MKRGTPEHPKVVRLAKMLGVRRCTAVGVLEMLWHLTARYTPRGDVGKWSDEEIATALDWDGVPERLTHALVSCGLLEEHPEHRLIVHDWPEHADKAVKQLLDRRGEDFIVTHVSTCGHNGRPSAEITALPEPKPEPEPKPISLRSFRARTTFPPDFVLTDKLRAFATAGGLDAEAEFSHFRDHHRSKGNKFADWPAAFRTWCRRCDQFPARSRG